MNACGRYGLLCDTSRMFGIHDGCVKKRVWEAAGTAYGLSRFGGV
jgi:hypothetical protein